MTETARIGKKVPNFEMAVYDPTRKDFAKISLDQLTQQGKWVALVFYPADYTFVCPTELADVAHYQDQIAKNGGVVISVSTDTEFTHMAWQREEKLLKDVKYLMAADPTGKVSRLFGVYDEDSGLALRGTFIISPAGLLTASEVNFYNVGRSAEELVRKLEANAHLAKHPNEACPANWKAGAKTLKPGANLVGRVQEALAN